MPDALPHATANRTRPLPPAIRRRLESTFGADFDGVRLHTGPAAERLARQAGGLACALDGRDIFLGPVPRRLRPFVLAHEAAHVVQQRLQGATQPAAAMEAEAGWATACVAPGRPIRLRISADPRTPAPWGEVGHYYTAYFVHLAAGLDDMLARKIAFYCQLPDEIDELDAVVAGVRIAVKTWPANRARGTADGVPGALFQEMDIQHGLHALTGANAEAESAKRAAIMLEGGGTPANYGLALHAFGDSFAHRKGHMMYAGPIGHGLDGHEPDIIGPHRRAMYLRYAGLVYDIAVRTFMGRVRIGGALGRLSREVLLDTLDTVMFGLQPAPEDHEQEERRLIPLMRQAAAGVMRCTMSKEYEPEKSGSRSFRAHAQNPLGFPFREHDLAATQRLAAAWAWGPSTFLGGGGTVEDVISRYPIIA